MTSCYITRRVTPKSKEPRYVVRFRLGGAGFPVIHAGSFPTMKEARARRDFVAGELAAGRDPREALRRLAPAKPARTVETEAQEWMRGIETVKTVSKGTATTYRSMLASAIDGLATIPVDEVAWTDIRDWVVNHADTLAPRTLRLCRTIQRLIFDHAGRAPNPARDQRIKLPTVVADEPNPPTAAELLTILERVPRWHVLPLVVLDQTGARVNEICELRWGDVDEVGERFRLRAETVKTRRGRWVQIPEWLMTHVAASCPREDRVPDRRVFPRAAPHLLRNAMKKACRDAGIAHYHPHDLRDRRITLWHYQGLPWKTVASRVGQSKASLTIDTYTHVLPVQEAPVEQLEAVLMRSP